MSIDLETHLQSARVEDRACIRDLVASLEAAREYAEVLQQVQQREMHRYRDMWAMAKEKYDIIHSELEEALKALFHERESSRQDRIDLLERQRQVKNLEEQVDEYAKELCAEQEECVRQFGEVLRLQDLVITLRGVKSEKY